MKRSAVALSLCALALPLALAPSCSSDQKDVIVPGGSGGTLGGGSGGNVGGGSGGTVGGGSGGAVGTGGAGTGGNVGSGGTPTTDAGMDAASDVNGGGSGGMTGGNAITKVRPTAGCGKATGPTGAQTIMTTGTKPATCADSTCGDWAYPRSYNVVLPAGYDNAKAYPLVFQGPGCAGSALDVYNLDTSVGGTVIRVGLAPPPNAIGHPTNPASGCFDDREGDDSVDFVFFENLWDRLADQFCFDQNRVFASGHSSGGSLAEEMACKYAGDARHPIRGVMANTTDLPTQPMWTPTCTSAATSGIFSHSVGDATASNRNAINRALTVNKCTMGTNIDNVTFDDFPIGGGNAAGTCKKVRGCPELFPVVVCPLPGADRSTHDTVANPGFATFVKMFESAPFLTP